ncbi:metallophosphoesterase [Pontibacter silvestris]|uniref:Metallophosphoesterase n=1 Tax=Pontibacter silvestris TaxID=2305183 RepID=A0ABW4WY62_9BACT|nr:metallophosphoesterase [Pontibacter silvestris]MCC9135315.1 metallophosphoesterase [Pontibacter silvestris]
MATEVETQHDNIILLNEHGPFHILGDIHGCFKELVALLCRLGYSIKFNDELQKYEVGAPKGYKAIFVGDLVDRGPNSPEVLRLVMDMVEQQIALCVIGNHDDKLSRMMKGHKVQVRYGLELTIEQMEKYDRAFHIRVKKFLSKLPYYIILDNGKLLIAHAGLQERLHGKNGKGVRGLCLYGPTTSKTDDNGLPVRLDWAAEYCGKAIVIYGHSPVKQPVWRNNTINIDTGCVFGGRLTAISYPDNEITSIEAFKTYAEPMRPFIDYQEHSFSSS